MTIGVAFGSPINVGIGSLYQNPGFLIDGFYTLTIDVSDGFTITSTVVEILVAAF